MHVANKNCSGEKRREGRQTNALGAKIPLHLYKYNTIAKTMARRSQQCAMKIGCREL